MSRPSTERSQGICFPNATLQRGHAAGADQGYSHVVGKMQARAHGREVGTETAEGEKEGKMT